MSARLLLVEDDSHFAFALRRMLEARGYFVDAAENGEAALAATRSRTYDVTLLDLGLPDVGGHELLTRLVEVDANSPVVVLSGMDDAGSAVRALKIGAWDYLTKPMGGEELCLVLEQVRERARLRTKIEAASRGSSNAGLVGSSAAWVQAIEAADSAAMSPRTPVLMTGESGTGKELCARLVHESGPRAGSPFVTVNAGAFSPALLESELFGHEAGAFTGARGMKRGVFELASGGTLFLDELGELPLDLQPKLLRVLDGHPFRRVGGEREVRVDVRVVSATNRSLEQEVAAGRFRLDLYHRLRVVEISLPPLRDRGDDVVALTVHFVGELSRELNLKPPSVSPEVLEAFRCYRWPGNVRELRNVLERALVVRRGADIELRDLPSEIARSRESRVSSGTFAVTPYGSPSQSAARLLPLEDVVREHVVTVFRSTRDNLSEAARQLGITRMTLRKKLRDYGVLAREPSLPD